MGSSMTDLRCPHHPDQDPSVEPVTWPSLAGGEMFETCVFCLLAHARHQKACADKLQAKMDGALRALKESA